MRVLYVEDERHLALAVAQVLKKNNYTVDLAYDGESGFDLAVSNIYDLIILDIMLPNMDGISLLRHLRKKSITTPLLLLTARGETADKVKGLDSGADDYLAKPFQTEELLARLRALGRRKGELAVNSILAYGDIELDYTTLKLSGSRQSFRLTLKESQLLELLIRNKNRVITNESIIKKLWGYDGDAEDPI